VTLRSHREGIQSSLHPSPLASGGRAAVVVWM
jgi:hypothetical protein